MDEPISKLSSAYILLVLVTITFGLAVAQNDENFSRQCKSKENCSDCIRTLGCAWCSNPGTQDDGEPLRCVSNHDIETSKLVCRDEWINPIAGHDAVLNNDLFSGDKNNLESIVQIQPQKIKLLLKPGEPYEVTIKYQQAQDYPVDLYYLMDLSSSMKDDKEKLSALGDNLALAMRNLTSDFKLGFGSFVDKREMPFVNTVAKKLENPCTGGLICTSPYKIGWRENARHMIVFSTDALSHYAGDGKLAGIVEPNDGKCHLDGNEYTHGLIQDYPSVSQINSKAIKHNMNIIFAIVSDMNSAYSLLKSRIQGSNTGVLNRDSSNVIAFVLDQYKSLEQSVMMTHTAPQSDFSVTFKSKCTKLDGELEPTDTCKGLRKDTIVEFKAEITALHCHEDPNKWKQSFQIKPQGLNERMIVDVEKCDCLESVTPNSTNTCGGTSNDLECSGRGQCKCGQCICTKPDNPEEDHGTCNCGICECVPGRWKGNNCECPVSEETCKEHPGERACSGKGDCLCGPPGDVGASEEPETSQPGQQGGFKDVETCSHLDEAGCTYKFRYFDVPGGTTYVFARKKECVSEVDILAVVLGVIGTILIAGLLLLMIWKIATTLHDRREFAKFENERKNAKWDRGSNPLYVQATSTFSNPTFGGNASRKSVVPQ
ncbi:hypothetical protein B566_EDAN014860 [Ephemera danica]|nr:hypothetical protein B566_EDAN014860 [Ephemera danica]